MNQLKRSLTVELQTFDLLFLEQHNVKSIRASMIIPRSETKLGRVYGIGSRMKQEFWELHKDWVEETSLDCRALEIVEQKKEVTVCQLQSEENLTKEKKAVDTLMAII